MRFRFRFDVGLALCLPFFASYCVYLIFDKINLNINIFYLILFVSLIFEAACLWEVKDQKKRKDNGVISGLITSSVISVVMITEAFLPKFQFEVIYSTLLFVAGIVILFIGTLLRFLSKIHLSQQFSHSLRLLPDHQLIQHGVYSMMRHPAYLGTVFIILGVSIFTGSIIGLIMLIACSPIGLRRIKNEEEMLLTLFPKEYYEYSKRTKRFLFI